MTDSPYLTGQLLVAMPTMPDPRFERTVIYLCAHSEQGAMGLIVNKALHKLPYGELMSQLNIDSPIRVPEAETTVHFGGPVETGRGFVLHTTDYAEASTLTVDSEISLTATIEVLKAIGDARGPRQRLLALGYAGWAPGQLDTEIQENGWLAVPADEELVFDIGLDSKWDRAVAKIGIDVAMLSGEAGRA